MKRYRLLVLMAVIGLSIPLMAPPAPAWEFSMDGAFVWEYEYRGQAGNQGFFGPYDLSAPQPTVQPQAYAPYNFWKGYGAWTNLGGMVSGSDASTNTIWMDANMQIRMNQALRIRGRYHIGQWANNLNAWDAQGRDQVSAPGQLVASQYLNYSASGVQRSFSPGYWNTLWLTAELPWGIVAFGKRPSIWGLGLGWNGEENRSSEQLTFSVPYGAFQFQVGFYPSRRGNNRYEYYNQDWDKNNTRLWDATVPNVVYRQGPLDMGAQVVFVSRHTGGEGIIPTNVSPNTRRTTLYTDYEELYGGVYFKYFNGRFFFNTEADWFYSMTRNRKKSIAGVPVGNAEPLAVVADVRDKCDYFREHWRFAAEAGTLAGPAQVTLMYAWSAAPDRRNGAYIDRSGLIQDPGIAGASFSNTGFFRPYSYLMVYAYGLGTHINADTNNGYVEDASILATKIDYAVASNLNVRGSFFYANRTTQSGYPWGFIQPDITFTDGRILWAQSSTNLTNLSHQGPTANTPPNIPETHLGWEVDAGFDWKLLEGFTVNCTFAYWQPGRWFSYACVDKAVTNWATAVTVPSVSNFWGVIPDRNIDPVWGLEIKVVGEF